MLLGVRAAVRLRRPVRRVCGAKRRVNRGMSSLLIFIDYIFFFFSPIQHWYVSVALHILVRFTDVLRQQGTYCNSAVSKTERELSKRSKNSMKSLPNRKYFQAVTEETSWVRLTEKTKECKFCDTVPLSSKV